ncbi:unnamed protein product [Rotaria magnacalcarata]|nr:unnamed protein product [Rotaria magnacalcarata]CAF4058352.1 unnamed protein product [Rotaria magnacalcarata]
MSIQCSYMLGAIFSVVTYGAYPNDNIDDTDAVKLAINKAIEAGQNNIVLFQSGTYNFKSVIGIYNANKLTVMGQGMQQTLLLGNAPAAMFQPLNCRELTITALAIDFDPLPFTAGYVVSVNPTYLDVQIVSPHKADIDRQVSAILRYNPTMMRPAFGPDTYEIYQDPPLDRNTSLVSNNILRIPLKNPTKFVIGDPIVARYSHNRHAIDAQDVTDLNIHYVTIYTSWLMGLVAMRAKGLNINNYHVIPRSGRWMSTPVDCMHFSDCRNYINITDSKCVAQGDDGLNVHAFYLQVTQIISSASLILREYNWPDVLNVGAGTRMEFSSSQQPFTVYTSATVISTSIQGPNARVFVFTGPVFANVGDWVSVADTPVLTVRNLTVANNRARGVLLKTRRVQITNSLFIGTSGPAVLFEPSLDWHESVAAQDVKLLQNVYINCNEGIARQGGVISFAPFPPQLNRIFYDVIIQSSTFLFGPYTEGLLQSINAANVYIKGNYIATNSSTPLVTICNSLNICAHNNTFVNNRFSVNSYIYDTRSLCREELSDLIGLPASGFDSHFAPPVVATKAGVQPYDHQTYTDSFNTMDLSNILSISNIIG